MKFETQCVQVGWDAKNGDPRVLPIIQSTTFKFDSSEHVADLFDLKVGGHFYTRLSNPTLDGLEQRIAAIEGGLAAMVTASGQSALSLAVLNLCSPGDHVVCSSAIYGGTYNLFNVTLRRMGIDFSFFDPMDSDEEIQKLFKPMTKLIFGETISNPALSVFDIERIATLAHKNDVPLMIDNSLTTPYVCKPIDYGCDIVIHATTKYLDGHALAVGGAIVDSGNFDWAASGRFPELCTPDPSYHGLVYTEAFGKAAYIVKARAQLMRDIGAQAAPMSAFLTHVGIETLPLRMARHCNNAFAVARFLEAHPAIESVNYPGLPSNRCYALAQKYLPRGAAGVVSFDIKGGRDAAMKLMNAFTLIGIVVHVADARTCVLHPASMTHRQLTDQQLHAVGISPNMVRLSVGIEHVDDIIADLEQALQTISSIVE